MLGLEGLEVGGAGESQEVLETNYTVEGKEEAAGLRDEFELFEEGHGD
jgi:hypothetical protein